MTTAGTGKYTYELIQDWPQTARRRISGHRQRGSHRFPG